MTVQRTLAQDLDDWERQLHAWTWRYSGEKMREVSGEVRAWAMAEGWPLDRAGRPRAHYPMVGFRTTVKFSPHRHRAKPSL